MSKNIAIIVPKLKEGGAERVAANLSLELPSNYNKFIFLFDDTNIKYPYNGKIIKIENKETKNILGKILKVFRQVMKVRKLKRKYNIDVTISHLVGPNFLNILSKVNDKVIITEHSYIRKKRISRQGKFLRKIYNKADKIVAVSDGVKKNLIENYNINHKKVETIYNFFDFKNIRIKAYENIKEKSLFKNPVIINVGRLTKLKGQWHLIKIFKEVKKEINDAKLVFLGEGPLRCKLENLSKKIGLESDIVFLGFKDNPYKYMRNSDVFAFTSLQEGLPMVIIEAMASGVPVISTDCKTGPKEILVPGVYEDISEVIYSKYGILTPAFDLDDFNFDPTTLNEREKTYANVLTNLMKDHTLRNEYKKNQKKRIEDFHPKNIIGEWIKIIED